MKKIFVLASFIAVFSMNSTSFAQSKNDSTSWKNITLGPFFMPGASTEAGTVVIGAKSQTMLFSWSAGLEACFPLSPNFAVQLSVGYDSRAIGFYSSNTSSSDFTNYKFNYFSIRPELRMGAFLIGLGIGLPVSADTTQGGAGRASNVGASNMNLLLEARVGATSALFTAENGNVLRFLISASYGLNQITDQQLSQGFATTPVANPDKAKNNGPFGTLQLGFAYEFNLSPHS